MAVLLAFQILTLRSGYNHAMAEPFPSARVIRAFTSDHQIRFAALNAGPLWDGVRRGHPQLEAGACAPLVETLCASLLLQSRTFFSERLQVLIKSCGRAKAIVADAWPGGDVRGVLDEAPAVADGPWVKAPGILQVMRSNPDGKPYTGTLELADGPIQDQIEAYLLQSEQIQASVTLWCDPSTGESGGLIVEPLPECPRDRMEALVAAMEGLEVVPLRERTPEFLAIWINQGSGAEVLAASDIRYHCRCSREALLETLGGFDPAKRQDLFLAGSPLEVHCDYCGKAYSIAMEDLPVQGENP
jgi:molecular chaperone Hsp33